MSHDSVTNNELSQYLDQDVPMSQLDDELANDTDDDDMDQTFIDAQLAFAKSKQGRQAQRKRSYYHKQRWQVGNKGSKGGDHDRD